MKLSPIILSVGLLLFVASYTSSATQVAETTISLSGSPTVHSAPAVIDLDGDGVLEILNASENGVLSIIDGRSHTILWEKNLTDYLPDYGSVWVEASVSAADLDNDGAIEVVIATGGRPLTAQKPGAVIVLSHRGGGQFALKSGWPQYPTDEIGNENSPGDPDGVPDGFLSTPALGDVDNDGDLEIVIGGMDRKIHAWHHDGAYVAGWPIGRERQIYRDTISSPALADIDSDGALEIIIGSNNYSQPACPNPYLFYVFEGDGSLMTGFPVETTQNIASSPAIGDLDGDGWLDIVVGTGAYNEDCGQEPDGYKVYAWDRLGRPLPGWPQKTAGNMETSPALGDVDGDGRLDVVIGCQDVFNRACNWLYAWRGDGTAINGFPMEPFSNPDGSLFSQRQGPVLADLDGDNALEIGIVAGDRVMIIENNGSVAEERKISRWWASGLTVADLDNDGLLETMVSGAAGNLGAIHIWEEAGRADGDVPWPTFGRNASRTALYKVEIDVDPSTLTEKLYLPLVRR